MVKLTISPLAWLRGFLSESTGEASSSRLIALASNVAALVLVYIVTLTKSDIPPVAQTILLCAMGSGTLGYLGNKLVTKTTALNTTSTTGEAA